MQPDVEVLADIVAAAIKSAQAPLLKRIADLEALQSTKSVDVIVGPPGPAGRDADVDGLKAAIVAELGTAAVTREEIGAWVGVEVTKAMAAVQMPRDGKDADVEEIRAIVQTEVVKAVAAVPIPKDGQDGRSVELAEVVPVVAAEVQKAMSAVPMPKDGAVGIQGEPGRSVDIADLAPVIAAEVTKAVSAIQIPKDGAIGAQGEPGRSIEPADVAPLIVAEVAKTLEQWERPKDGASVTVEDVAPLVEASVTKAVSALPVPKDGVGLAGALVDRDGHLVVTLTDGTVKQLGSVIGRDVDIAEVTKQIADAVAQFPRPKDGEPGRDGTLENLKMLRQDERTIVFAMKDGTPIDGGTIILSHPVFADTFSLSKSASYRAGDMVQFDGSGWIALRDAPPGEPGRGNPADTGWRLWIKKGSAGANGKNGIDGKNGKDGRDGKDRY